MFVVDTNILVHASNDDGPLHEACRSWHEEQRGKADAWFLTWSIIYEFTRVITHPRVLTVPWQVGNAWRFVDALRTAPSPEILGAVFEEMPHLAGNILHDAHTAILVREHGVRRIPTRDTDFHRFSFLDPFDPVP